MSQHLSTSLRNLRLEVRDIAHSIEDHAHADRIKDAADLLGVLANICDGKSVLKAFGAPGDWGYDTPIGHALLRSLEDDARSHGARV